MPRTQNLATLFPGEDDTRPPRKRLTDPSLGPGGGATPGLDDSVPGGGRPPLFDPEQTGDGVGGGGTGGALDDIAASDPGYDPYYGLGGSGGAEEWTGADLGRDAGYQFRLAEAQRAQDKLQAQRGNFYSGDALKEALRLSQGMAHDETAAAYNRYAGERAYRQGERERLFRDWTGEDQRRWDNQFRGGQQEWENAFRTHGQQFADWYNLAQLGLGATGSATGTQQHAGDQNQQAFYDLMNAYLASLGQGGTTGGH